jgi:hypothetical protein
MNTGDKAGRRIPRGLLVVAVLAGFVASFGIAVAIGSIGESEDDHPGGPTSKRMLVARGTTPGEIGRWRVWRSFDAGGDECVEVQLLDDPLDDRAPEEYRREAGVPVPGGGTLSGGCGSEAELDLATVSAARETLVYGRAPQAADEVSIEVGGREARRVQLEDPPEGARSKYFGVAVASREGGIRARARDAAGNELRSLDVPTPGP